MNTYEKLTHGSWLLTYFVFLVTCASITFLMPVVSALENETSAILSITADGRFQLAWRSFIGILLVSLIPAGFIYCLGKGIKLEVESPTKMSPHLKMALLMWAALVIIGFIGAMSFWLQIHPLQPA